MISWLGTSSHAKRKEPPRVGAVLLCKQVSWAGPVSLAKIMFCSGSCGCCCCCFYYHRQEYFHNTGPARLLNKKQERRGSSTPSGSGVQLLLTTKHLVDTGACASGLGHFSPGTSFLLEGLCILPPRELHSIKCGWPCADHVPSISTAHAPHMALIVIQNRRILQQPVLESTIVALLKPTWGVTIFETPIPSLFSGAPPPSICHLPQSQPSDIPKATSRLPHSPDLTVSDILTGP